MPKTLLCVKRALFGRYCVHTHAYIAAMLVSLIGNGKVPEGNTWEIPWGSPGITHSGNYGYIAITLLLLGNHNKQEKIMLTVLHVTTSWSSEAIT